MRPLQDRFHERRLHAIPRASGGFIAVGSPAHGFVDLFPRVGSITECIAVTRGSEDDASPVSGPAGRSVETWRSFCIHRERLILRKSFSDRKIDIWKRNTYIADRLNCGANRGGDGVIAQAWQYALAHPDKLLEWTWQHVQIVLVANAFAALIGVTLGVWVSGKGREKYADAVIYAASILMTIPSLALFGILMAVLYAMGLSSIGFLPVVIALTLYGLLPIVRNTHTALREVDPAMIEAGQGMGMSGLQLLFKIKMPLAVPVIMAGLRQAMVMNVGIAAIGSYLGAGGLGQPIFRGLGNYRKDLVLLGAVAVSVLAILIDVVMSVVERLTTPKGIRIGRKH